MFKKIIYTILIISGVIKHISNLDCRKTIFAPGCRGITAKRTQLSYVDPDPYQNEDIGKIYFANKRNPSLFYPSLRNYRGTRINMLPLPLKSYLGPADYNYDEGAIKVKTYKK
ncbi:unnamed protein product [Gordionus sp. m RMFG-2023]